MSSTTDSLLRSQLIVSGIGWTALIVLVTVFVVFVLRFLNSVDLKEVFGGIVPALIQQFLPRENP